MTFTKSTIECVLLKISEICPNDKITKGNVEKLRTYNRALPGSITENSRKYAMYEAISYIEHELRKSANRRMALAQAANHVLNFDWSTVSGCVGFERGTYDIK